MLPLLLVGITLGGHAVAYVNGRRDERVRAEIDGLLEERERLINEQAGIAAQLDAITDAERAERHRLIRPYLERLRSLAVEEAEVRRVALEEIQAALEPALDRIKNPLGDHGPDFYTRQVAELERHAASLRGEAAFYDQAAAALDAALGSRSGSLPDPRSLIPPHDFPREGGSVQLEGDRTLHGYDVTVDQPTSAPGRLLALYEVDHAAKTAQACPIRGALVAAMTREDGGLEAVVKGTPRGAVIADYFGVELVVDARKDRRLQNLRPQDPLTVYPVAWTLEKVLTAPRDHQRLRERGELRDADRLRASDLPRVAGMPSHWSPVPVEVDQAQWSEVVRFVGDLDEVGFDDQPWTVEADGDHVVFSYDRFAMHLSIDREARAFRLVRLSRSHVPQRGAVQLSAELDLYLPGDRDDAELEGAPFSEFIEALADDLQSHKARDLRRQGGLALKKLALVYEDQAAAERERSSQPIFVTSADRMGSLIEIEAVTVGDPAEWLTQAMVSGRPWGIKAVSGAAECDVVRVQDGAGDLVRFAVRVPRASTTFDPLEVTHLTDSTAGRQQEVLTRALDDTIHDEYESAAVRSDFLSPGVEAVAHKDEGADAVYRAASRASGVYAVWGPPGTGKTTLIVRLLADAIAEAEREERSLNVLVSAPTHVAVDEILQRLLDEAPYLRDRTARYGSEERVGGGPLAPLWHRAIIEDAKGAGSGPLGDEWAALGDTHQGRVALARWVLRGRRIHGVTCVGMARRDLALTEQAFDLAIVDEAGKAFLAELLVPARHARRVIVVGDHNQLPPTVTREALDESIRYRLGTAEVEEILRENAFQKLFDRLPPEHKGMLDEQYRMDPDIGDAVSSLFYKGQLKNGRERNPWPWTRHRLHLVDFSEVAAYRNERTPGGSQRNVYEAQLLVDLVLGLARRAGRVLPKTLVICPYAGQRALVARLLARHGVPDAVKVTTVDAVQGGEAELVFLLMTRSRGRTEFLLDEHRLNVALSRAQEAVVVLGHADHLRRRVQGGPKHNVFDRFVRSGTDAGTLHLHRLLATLSQDDVEALWGGPAPSRV